jgi:ribosomal protein S18 acetylase RimI-like enzyme
MRISFVQRSNFKRLVEIDKEWCGDVGWHVNDFASFLSEKDTCGIVVEVDDVVVGYCLYSLKSKSIVIYRLAVAEAHRRTGVGRSIVTWLKRRVDCHVTRNSLTAFVPEDNMLAQVWFREVGVPYKGTVQSKYEAGDVYYHFVWQGLRDAPTHRMHSAIAR